MSADDQPSVLILDSLPESRTWTERAQESDVAALPAAPAVYAFLSAGARVVQLATAQNLRRIVAGRLLDPGRPARGKTDLAEIVRAIRWRGAATAFESRWWYYRLARTLHPDQYRRLISFGPAWFLHIDWGAAAPEIEATDAIWRRPGQFVGPFPTRPDCHAALTGLRDLFDLCRYPEEVRRAPHGRRCAYADMGRCDAPCDGSVPLAAMIHRTREAWRFAQGGVDSWLAQAERRMLQAAAEQRFELAGQIKQQIEFARKWRGQWSRHARAETELQYALALPATRRRAWRIFLFRYGELIEGPLVARKRFRDDAAAFLAGALSHKAEPETPDPIVRMEQTWLLTQRLFSRDAEHFAIERIAAADAARDVADRLHAALRTAPPPDEPPETVA
jgi:excinuclease UvrABC nuclease subunit